MNKFLLKRQNWLLVIAIISMATLPLIFVKGEYGGADGQATQLIEENNSDYQPWFNPIIELPSGEVESFFFATQAALGAGLIGYGIGLYKGRKKNK